jgi:hypothetical protein
MRLELGHYIVNGAVYINKMQAILEAQKTNSEPQWIFHDNEFSKANWLVEPDFSLDEIYKQRALQIREKYDYIVLMVSGGADSTNMLYSFLNNGIHVDEVVGMTPISGMNNWDFNNKDKSVINTASEYKYAQLPLMHYVTEHYPRTKVTMVDTFEKMYAPKTDEWMLDCQDIVNVHTTDMGRIDNLGHVKKLADAGKRIAVVMGTDKPVVTILPDNSVVCLLVDMPVNVPKLPFKEGYPNVDRLLFYWTHEMPEVVIKQSHVVAKSIFLPENQDIYKAIRDMARKQGTRKNDHLSTEQVLNKIITERTGLKSYDPKSFDPKTTGFYDPHNTYQRRVPSIIYPTTWDTRTFQGGKMDDMNSFFSDNHAWFFLVHKNTRSSETMISDFSSLYKTILPKFLNANRTGFKKFIKFYKIGNVSDFNTVEKRN